MNFRDVGSHIFTLNRARLPVSPQLPVLLLRWAIHILAPALYQARGQKTDHFLLLSFLEIQQNT